MNTKNIVFDPITGYTNSPPISENTLIHGDDVMLTAYLQGEMQKMVNIWKDKIVQMGMEINTSMCSAMLINGNQMEKMQIVVE